MARNMVLWVVIALVLMLVFQNFTPKHGSSRALDYSDFVSEVKSGRVAKVKLDGQTIEVETHDGSRLFSYSPETDNGPLIGLLLDNNVRIEAQPPDRQGLLMQIFISWFPFLLLIAVWIYLMRQMQGGGGGRGALSFGKSRARMLGEDQVEAAIAGATHILVTHGHFDHTTDLVEISQRTGAPVSGPYELAGHLHGARDRRTGAPVSGPYELAGHLHGLGATEGHAFGLGGTIDIGGVTATLVPASHSSSMQVVDATRYMGAECGFMIKSGGKCLYVSGDTDIMADMDWMGDYHKPDVGILSAGGYFTMDMAAAAYAAKRYFNFSTVIPCHYRTFPLLEQSAQALTDGLPGVNVVEPEVMTPISV